MSKDLSASIQRLQEKSSRLNEITDKANQSVRMAEKYLSKCSIGVNAWITVIDDDVNSTFIEYRKHNGKFQIVLVFGDETITQHEVVKLWSECSRDLKLKAIQKLPALLDEIANKLDTSIEVAESATESVFSALTKLTGKEA